MFLCNDGVYKIALKHYCKAEKGKKANDVGYGR